MDDNKINIVMSFIFWERIDFLGFIYFCKWVGVLYMEGLFMDIFIVLIMCKVVKCINFGYDVCIWDFGSLFILLWFIIGFWI